jgi:hypothetical protein
MVASQAKSGVGVKGIVSSLLCYLSAPGKSLHSPGYLFSVLQEVEVRVVNNSRSLHHLEYTLKRERRSLSLLSGILYSDPRDWLSKFRSSKAIVFPTPKGDLEINR